MKSKSSFEKCIECKDVFYQYHNKIARKLRDKLKKTWHYIFFLCHRRGQNVSELWAWHLIRINGYT